MNVSNSTVSASAVNTFRIGFRVFGSVPAPEVTRLRDRYAAAKAKQGVVVESRLIQDVSRVVQAGSRYDLIVVVAKYPSKDLMDDIRPLRHRRIRLHFTVGRPRWVLSLCRPQEWEALDEERSTWAWEPVDWSTWTTTFGSMWLSERRAGDDREVGLNLLGHTPSRVLEKDGWRVRVDLKGLHLVDLPAEYVQWMLSRGGLDPTTQDAFDWASCQLWYRQQLELLERRKAAAEGDRDDGFCPEWDSTPQNANGFSRTDAEDRVEWRFIGYGDVMPLRPWEDQERLADWRVIGPAVKSAPSKEDRDHLYDWDRWTKVLRHMEAARDLDELFDAFRFALTKQSRPLVGRTPKGRIELLGDTEVTDLRWALPQELCVDPDTGEEHYAAVDGCVEEVLEAYEQARQRIRHHQETVGHNSWVLEDDEDEQIELRFRCNTGARRRVDKHEQTRRAYKEYSPEEVAAAIAEAV